MYLTVRHPDYSECSLGSIRNMSVDQVCKMLVHVFETRLREQLSKILASASI